MKFLRTFFASLLAFFVGAILMFFLGFIVLGIIASSSQQDEVVVRPKSVLEIQLTGTIVENASPEPFDFDKLFPSPIPGASTSTIGLYQITQSLELAQKDNNIKGIYLNLQGGVNGGWASLSSIRKALEQFKASGKFIYAYSEIFSEGAYYLASVADSIYMPEIGMMELNGLASSPMFYTGLLKKLEVEPKIFKVGTFKSAVEPYLRENMSDSSRLQTEQFLGDFWDVFAKDVAATRPITVDKINEIADTYPMLEASQAKAMGLIDQVGPEVKAFEALKKAVDLDLDASLRSVSLKKYQLNTMKLSGSTRSKIAVIMAEGVIMSGNSSDGTVGSETIIKELRRARKNDRIKAVVLRVNSPGGSALASDIIAEEVRLTKAQKPVIVSMGDVAASGGYYIAADADQIFAQENTITGSIGIFLTLFDTGKMFKDKLGITFDQVETHEFAGLGNLNIPMTAVEEAFFQKFTEKGYGRFIQTVQNGRNFPDSVSVDRIAQGRVWSGKAAKDLKLVDELGDLEDAVNAAAEASAMGDDYRIEVRPPVKTFMEELMGSMNARVQAYQAANDPLAEEKEILREIKRYFPSGSGLYALMPLMGKIE